MIFGGGVIGVLLVAFWIWALVDIVTSDAKQVRNLPKLGWLLIVLLLSTFGALAWTLLGRPKRVSDEREARAGARFPAPEDGPRWPTDHARREHYAAMDEELDRRLEEKRRQDQDPSV